MHRDKSESGKEKGIVHRHIHHHYHYYYPPEDYQELLPFPNHLQQSHFQQQRTRSRTQEDENRRMGREGEQWKKHLNPEVGKMYDEYHLKASISSEKRKVSEEETEYEQSSPRKSEMIFPGHHSSIHIGNKRSPSKLEELYYQSRGRREGEDEKNFNSQISMATREDQIEEKLGGCIRQIQRLRKVEEECQFLREKFILHIQGKHPKEF